jgi:hypothetical protein
MFYFRDDDIESLRLAVATPDPAELAELAESDILRYHMTVVLYRAQPACYLSPSPRLVPFPLTSLSASTPHLAFHAGKWLY